MNSISPFEKIVSDDSELSDRLLQLPRPIVFTNGVFDILHKGHVTCLFEASKLGKTLIVALNTNRSVKMLGKGDDRPLNDEFDRALVMAGLGFVNLVMFFDDKTPVESIKKIRPDVYVKGGDYKMDELEETQLVKSWNGTAISIPFVHGYSTTKLVARIRQL